VLSGPDLGQGLRQRPVGFVRRRKPAYRRTLASMSLPTVASRPWRRWRTAALIAVVLGYAWAGAGLRSFTWPAMVSTSLGGLAVLVLAWQRNACTATTRVSREGLVAWTAWLAAATGWELWALSGQPRSTHPTLSSLINIVIETHPGRSVALLAWLALGWWLASG